MVKINTFGVNDSVFLMIAKILEDNPTLMRMRELEVVEKIAEKSKMTIVLGEQDLTDRLTKLV